MVGFYKAPVVLVVHCVDTEGPIGGDVRRNPDGSAEFMANWKDIKETLHDITNDGFRQRNKDSFGNSYKYNWFIMDFMGFKTNPNLPPAQLRSFVLLKSKCGIIKLHQAVRTRHHGFCQGMGTRQNAFEVEVGCCNF